MKETIHRVYGPIQYCHEGIRKYSDVYVQGLQDAGYNIKRYTIPFKSRTIMRFFYQFVIIPFLLLINVKKNDKIVFYEEFYTPLAYIFKKNTFYIIHHINPEILQQENVSFFGRVFIKIYLFSFKQLKTVGGVITVSERSKKEIMLAGIPEEKISVLYNAFDDIIFKESNNIISTKNKIYERYNIPTDKKILTHISVFHPRKNFSTIIESLYNFDDNAHLIKVGSILDQEEYTKNIAMLKKYNISYTRIENLDDIKTAELLQGSDLFLFSSIFEGFGRPPILAQLCGCPAVSTHGGALAEILGDSCHIITDPLNYKEYIDGIRKILYDNQYRTGIVEKGLSNSEKYKAHNLIKKIIGIINC